MSEPRPGRADTTSANATKGSPGTHTNAKPSGSSPPLGAWPTLALIAVGVITFGLVTFWVIRRAGGLEVEDEVLWLRAVTVWDGTIGFLSFLIGGLLGIAVQVQRVNQANEAKEEAKTEEASAKKKSQETQAVNSELNQRAQQLALQAQSGRNLAQVVVESTNTERVSASRVIDSPQLAVVDSARLFSLVGSDDASTGGKRFVVAPETDARSLPESMESLDRLAKRLLDGTF